MKKTSAIKLLLHHYAAQMKRRPVLAALALLLPGIGSIFVFYIPPLVVGKLAGQLAESGNLSTDELMPYVLAFVGLWSIGEIIWRLGFIYLARLESVVIQQLYIDAMAWLLKKDARFYADNFTGSLTKRTIAYAKSFESFVDVMSFSVIASLLPVIFGAVVLWGYSPWLVVALFGMVGFSLAVIIPLIKRRQLLVADREVASNVLSGHISDVIGNMSAVQSFAKETSEAATHYEYVDDYIKKTKRSWDYHNLRIDMVLSPLYVLTNTLGLVLALRIGGTSAMNVEAIFVSFSYFTIFTKIMFEFNQVYRRLETSVTEAAQFTELLLDSPRVKNPTHPAEFNIASGHVRFLDVRFSYENNLLFDGLNLEIKPGEKVGLVGRSGGGKTTLTKILLRYVNIDSGKIEIDGLDIAQSSLQDVRRSISYVPQDPQLFHRTIADNIAYGADGASKDAIIKAAKLAHADIFIDSLPHKYDTLVGERGVKLSGGQRQRIAIARAMLKNSPLLVLDEATSALDSESEALIQDALWKLMQNKTAIVIAHRLSTIAGMDRIVVLDEGKVIEQGSHKDLIKLDGTYAKLWQHQSGGFIED